MTRSRCRILGLAVLLAGLPAAVFAGAGTVPSRDFFPVSAWYPGGKARAPMLETVTPESAAAWRTAVRTCTTCPSTFSRSTRDSCSG